MSASKVLLSTTSVYPESTTSAFELAAALGYDGIELMVGIDPLAADVDAVAKLADYHGVQVFSVHAPVLLVTQNVWGSDPWEKLDRSGQAARRLGADVVVVHPPFRWQREYGEGFVEGIRTLNESFDDVMFAVENMYPWRTLGGSFQAYLPHWDPTDFGYEYLTLDLSHASTARVHSLHLVHSWGDRLRHVHLTDGTGSFKDEHLMPGEGDQDAWDVLRALAAAGFDGHTVLEVSTRRSRNRHEREELLGQALEACRRSLARGYADA